MPQLVSGRFDPLTDDTLFIRIDHEWFKGQLRWSPHILRGPAAPRTKRTQKEHTYARFFTRHNSTGRYCWERVLAMGILSVCLSVTTRYGFKALWDRDSGSSPCDSLGSVVSYEIIWCHSVKRFPSNVGIKEGTPLRNPYFTIIGSSSVKTVADRHRLAAYHNKHCRRAFQRYQHRWPWTTLNPPNWCPITNVVYSYFAQKQHMSCPVAMCHSVSHRESKLHAACQKAKEKFVDTRVDREAWRFGAYNEWSSSRSPRHWFSFVQELLAHERRLVWYSAAESVSTDHTPRHKDAKSNFASRKACRDAALLSNP